MPHQNKLRKNSWVSQFVKNWDNIKLALGEIHTCGCPHTHTHTAIEEHRDFFLPEHVILFHLGLKNTTVDIYLWTAGENQIKLGKGLHMDEEILAISLPSVNIISGNLTGPGSKSFISNSSVLQSHLMPKNTLRPIIFPPPICCKIPKWL